MAAVDQLPEFRIEAGKRRRAADQCCSAANVLVQGCRTLEAGLAEAQVLGMRGVRREPFGVDVEHEENRTIAHVSGHEIVRLPRIDGDDRVLREEPLVVAHVDPRRCAADVKDQMPLAMRMHVERAVQLIDRRATEPAVEDGKRSAHAFPSRGMFLSFFFRPASIIPGGNSRAWAGATATISSRSTSAELSNARVGQYFLHSGIVRLGRPILANTAGS